MPTGDGCTTMADMKTATLVMNGVLNTVQTQIHALPTVRLMEFHNRTGKISMVLLLHQMNLLLVLLQRVRQQE